MPSRRTDTAGRKVERVYCPEWYLTKRYKPATTPHNLSHFPRPHTQLKGLKIWQRANLRRGAALSPSSRAASTIHASTRFTRVSTEREKKNCYESCDRLPGSAKLGLLHPVADFDLLGLLGDLFIDSSRVSYGDCVTRFCLLVLSLSRREGYGRLYLSSLPYRDVHFNSRVFVLFSRCRTLAISLNRTCF